MQITKKEYIKNFIIRSIKGKVDWIEVKQVRNNLMNYSREDWQDLKVIGKELAKEAIDEQINLIKEDKVPSDWKLLARDFSHSAVNLFFAIFNEEVFYQGMLLEKQSGLDQQTKIIKLLPVISQSMDRIVARVPSKSANWKADKSLTTKIKKVVNEVKGIYFQTAWRGKLDEEEIKQKASKWIQILESLTEEEIAILKSKLKILVNKLIDKYAPPQIKNSPEIRQFINSSMNLMDALGGEKIYKELINIAAKTLKQTVQNQQIWDGENPLVLFQNTGTETEVKNLIRNYIQHLNKLAGEGEKNTLSTEREESIIQRLTENNSNPQPNQEDTNLGDIWKNNLLTQGLSSGGNQVNLTEQDFLNEFENVLLNTQIKPKWYQNPWIIWPLVAGAFVVGGLITWWLTRRKKEKKIDRQSGYWN